MKLLNYHHQEKEMVENRVFKSFKELGTFLQKKRRIKGEKIDFIATNLIIKKKFLKSFEEGILNERDFIDNPHLKGFLNSYIRYLKCENECKIDNLFYKEDSFSIKGQKVSLESGTDNKNSYGSLIILFSILFMSLIYLLWNKQTYKQLYNLGKLIN